MSWSKQVYDYNHAENNFFTFSRVFQLFKSIATDAVIQNKKCLYLLVHCS
jgi:hypothetical protein